MRIFLISLLLTFATLGSQAGDIPKVKSKRPIKEFFQRAREHRLGNHNKAVAATLDVTMGFFGVHRLYLGTRPGVPIIYACTLGGGGFLVFTDFLAIVATDDLEKYANNERIFMWSP